MEVINPIGRDFSLENDADYSTLSTACRCSNSSSALTSGSKGNTCSCGTSSTYGSLYTNIYKG